MMSNHKDIDGVHYMYSDSLDTRLQDLHERIQSMRAVGKLSPQNLKRIRSFFKIKGIYHSNAIEGNALTVGETRMVVERGLTLAGKALRDQAEAKNLSHALDFMEELASSSERPITERDVRQIHELILKDIEDSYAGKYRDTEVVISGSEYKPPSAQQVPMDMADLGAYISAVTSTPTQESPMLVAAAIHAWLAQIHPFIDGNGRTARILMNLILIRYGYPICIITREDRLRYYDALEESQAGGDLSPLIELMRENVEESLEEWEKAAEEQRQEQEWLESITARFEKPEIVQAQNEYEVWLKAMALLKSYFKQEVEKWNKQFSVGTVSVHFRDFGTLDFHKYVSLRDGGSAKRTWDFGVEFRRGNRRARYLLFYGYSDYRLRRRARVVLNVAKDIDYSYERLLDIKQPNKPDIYQVGFDMKEQAFVALKVSGVWSGKVESLARQFFTQVVERDFGG
ncbi:MAG: Fic family protein [Chloroflexi bacterium]|nr:Fic family protein [Chloroflexota bacterium]